MPDAASLVARVTADTSAAEHTLSGFGGKLQGIAGNMGALLGGAALAAGASVAAGLAVGVKGAGDLEQAVANIRTIKPEIDTSAVFASLNEMQTRVPQSAADLGDALYNVFSSVNVSQQDAIKLTEEFARSSVGAQTDAMTFGTSVLGVMNAYGLAVEDASHISDVFFNTIAAGVVTGQELASSLGPVTQTAKAAGVSLDTLGGLLVGVTKAGGPAAQNINNLNNFLAKVTTTDAQKAMNKLGVATVDASGKFRAMPAILTDLKKNLASLTEAERAASLQAIFPDAQARQGAQVLMDQIDAVNDAIDTNITQTGAAGKAYETMAATFNSQSKLLGQTFQSILTTLGAEVLPAITPLVAQFSQALPGAMRTAGDAVGTFKQAFAGNWRPDGVDASGKVIWVDPMVAQFGKIGTIAGDSWRTFKESLAGTWQPGGVDESGNVVWVDPFVASVGRAGQALKNFQDFLNSPEFTAAAEHTKQNLGDVGTELDKLAARFQSTQQQAGPDFSKLWGMEQISGELANTMDALNTFADVFAALTKGIGLSAQAVKQIFTGDWMGATESVNTAAAEFGKIPGIIDANLKRSLERTTAAAPAISAQARDTWAGYITTTDVTLAGLSPVIDAAMVTADASLGDGMTTIGASAAAAFVALQETYTGGWDAVVATTDPALTQIAPIVDTNMAAANISAASGGDTIIATLDLKFGESVGIAETQMPKVTSAVVAEQGPAGAAAAGVGDAMVAGIQPSWGSLIADAGAAGAGMVSVFASSVRAKLGEARAAAESMVEQIRSLLPHSDADTGPLSDITAAGAALPTTLARGITSASGVAVSAVESMVAKALAAIDPGMTRVAANAGAGVVAALSGGISKGGGQLTDVMQIIVNEAIKNGIDPMIALALAKAESGFNPRASNISGEDSHGLFQHNRAGGQGTGFSVAQLQDPSFSASKFLGDHAALYKQLVAEGLAGEKLVQVFGKLAEGSAGNGSRYVDAYRALTAELGTTSVAGQQATTTMAALGATQKQATDWAKVFADQQAALSQTLSGQAPPMRATTDAIAAFGAVLGPIERQVAGGAISLDTLQFKMVDLARATGLASKPWADYDAGLIDIDQAMERVINQSADAGPQFEALRQYFATAGSSSREAALQFLQLALNYKAGGQVITAAGAAVATAADTAANAITGGTTGGAATSLAAPIDAQSVAFDALKPKIDAASTSTTSYQAAVGALDVTRISDQMNAWNGATESVLKLYEATRSLGDYLDGHEFKFHIELPDLPDWAIPGSPTPFEIGLRGIAGALKDVNQTTGPNLRGLSMPQMAGVGMAAPSRSGSADTYVTVQVSGSVVSEGQLVKNIHEGFLKLKRTRGKLGLND